MYTCTAYNKHQIDLTRGCKLLPCIQFIPSNPDKHIHVYIFIQCRIIKLKYDSIVNIYHGIVFKTSLHEIKASICNFLSILLCNTK